MKYITNKGGSSLAQGVSKRLQNIQPNSSKMEQNQHKLVDAQTNKRPPHTKI